MAELLAAGGLRRNDGLIWNTAMSMIAELVLRRRLRGDRWSATAGIELPA